MLAMTTDYRGNEFLDETDRAVFAAMKARQPRRYAVAGLGEWGVTEGLVFERWEDVYKRQARWKPCFKRRNRALGEKILVLALKLWKVRGYGWKMTTPLDQGGIVQWDEKVGTSWTI